MLLSRFRKNLFLKNLTYLGSSEGISRIFKLLPTLILARYLSQSDFGIVAISLTTLEFSRIFTLSSGLGTRLIQETDEHNIKLYSNTSYWLSWIMASIMALIHIPLAFITSYLYHEPKVILPLLILGLSFLLNPIGQTHFFLTMKDNNLGKVAKINTINTAIGSIASCSLAFLSFGYWSVILPQLLTGLLWGLHYKRTSSWKPSTFSLQGYQHILGVGLQIIFIEILNKLRANIDYMLVGAFLGVNALGLYYFAFTSGLGISLSAIGAFNTALLPYLCKHKQDKPLLKHKFLSTLKNISFIIIPLVLLQSSLAPFYVPILFSSKWIPAIPIIILICLSAIPRPFAEGAGSLLIALDKTSINLKWNLLFTCFFSLCILFTVQWGIIPVAVTVCAVHWLLLPLYTLWVYKYCFK